MRFTDTFAAVFVLACLLLRAPAAPANIVVTSWNLACGVVDGNGNQDFARVTTVQTPLSTAHQGTIPPSVARGTYQATFDPQSFNFRVDTSLSAAGAAGSPLPPLQSACTGSIRVSTDSELRLFVDSALAFSLAPGDREVVLSVNVVRSAGPSYFSGGGSSAPIFGEPASGVLTAHGESILLPANASYGLSYTAELASITGNPSALSHADGWVQFGLQVVPETNTITLILLTGFWFHRRLSFRRST